MQIEFILKHRTKIIIIITLIVLYYLCKSNLYENLEVTTESQTNPEEQEKNNEKEFRTFLYNFKINFLRRDRLDIIKYIKNTIIKITVCENEKTMDIKKCLKSHEYEIYQEMQESKSTRGKLYKELFGLYKTNNNLPTDQTISIILSYF